MESEALRKEEKNEDPRRAFSPVKDEKPLETGKREEIESLLKLIKLTGRSAALPLVNFIKQHLSGTSLIFVVGETGSGKTTLLSEITKQDLKVGSGTRSGTIGHQVVPAIVHGKQYIFVDTPGYGAADLDDKVVYDDIMGCVYALGPWVNTVGVLFVHDMCKIRLTAGEMKTIQWLQCFCGPRFFHNITIVLTQWDRIHQDELEEAYQIGEEFKRDAFHSILHPSHGVIGGRVYNHGLITGSSSADLKALSRKKFLDDRRVMAANFVRDYYGHVQNVPKLQVKTELDLGWSLYEIQAAKCLFTPSPSSITVVVLREKAMVLDVDAAFDRKDDKKEDLSPSEGDSESPPNVWKWWEVAKEAAWLFFRSKVHLRPFVDLASYTAEQWSKVSQWWSGESPPQ
ncbi:P-loop containing nucleoside triphosphate hydrolase protein [Penicillium chermesinum]|uniref:P-loop containing nucleoside triphosphate hydrolase protein n=1 Tax=Penicillium chermesinum TaxID=63820 RepID=A0A9W9NGP0_9EURO|nr:P-loop containing nucleoside triphosphate hydrolase protein [Penicillium chermesinum]KAJ5219642.1 P-loop containing nucleoside triphosphate hydrolase protein [Penicillium chermesinum]